jgi:hypothetical protein
MSSSSSSAERRNSYRVNQDVIFDFRQVDTHTAEQLEPEEAMDDGVAMHLVAELRRIDRDAQQLLKIVTDKQRLLADYLQKLNSKIDLIARHAVFASSPNSQALRLNISEGGVSFRTNRALYKGNFLVLRMIFLPSYTPVVVFGVVGRCESDKEGFRVAAKFHRLRDQDRQELARQILKAQVSNRKKGAAPENNP